MKKKEMTPQEIVMSNLDWLCDETFDTVSDSKDSLVVSTVIGRSSCLIKLDRLLNVIIVDVIKQHRAAGYDFLGELRKKTSKLKEKHRGLRFTFELVRQTNVNRITISVA